MTKKKTAAQDPFYSPTPNQNEAAQTAPKVVAAKPKGVQPPKAVQSALPSLAVDDAKPDLTADAAFATPVDERVALQADVERIRSVRKPFGAFTQKLALPARPGYHRHWFSDEPGRVDEALSSGWAHVNDQEGKPVRRVVGRGRDGGAMYGYAMEIPKVFWDEDQQARHEAASARVDEIRKQPFRSKPGQAQKSDEGKFYSPQDEVVSVRGPGG